MALHSAMACGNYTSLTCGAAFSTLHDSYRCYEQEDHAVPWETFCVSVGGCADVACWCAGARTSCALATAATVVLLVVFVALLAVCVTLTRRRRVRALYVLQPPEEDEDTSPVKCPGQYPINTSPKVEPVPFEATLHRSVDVELE